MKEITIAYHPLDKQKAEILQQATIDRWPKLVVLISECDFLEPGSVCVVRKPEPVDYTRFEWPTHEPKYNRRPLRQIEFNAQYMQQPPPMAPGCEHDNNGDGDCRWCHTRGGCNAEDRERGLMRDDRGPSPLGPAMHVWGRTRRLRDATALRRYFVREPLELLPLRCPYNFLDEFDLWFDWHRLKHFEGATDIGLQHHMLQNRYNKKARGE